MSLRKGSRVVVDAFWSSFHTMKGRVTETSPYLMILIDGDRLPIRIEEQAVIEIEENAEHCGE